MIIYPALLKKSFFYNWKTERAIGEILTYLGVEVADFSNESRPEYDYTGNGVQLEQKVTSKYEIPVETHKDQARQVPSGLLSSTSPITITLSVGGPKTEQIGKLRAFWTRDLLKATEGRSGIFYKGATPSQSAYVIDVPCIKNVFLSDLWLGNLETVFTSGKGIGFDTDMFDSAPGTSSRFLTMLALAKEIKLQ